LLLVTSIGAVRSEEKKVVVSGQPPLTQDMIDDYAKFLSWRLGPEALAKTGGPDRLATSAGKHSSRGSSGGDRIFRN
jgi:hypothetical protein